MSGPNVVRLQTMRVKSLVDQFGTDEPNEAKEAGTPLKGAGGGGTFDGMEIKVARLESDMDYVKKSLDRIERGQDEVRKTVGELKNDFGRFDERSKHFPSKGFIFTVCTGLLSAFGVITAVIVRFLPAAS